MTSPNDPAGPEGPEIVHERTRWETVTRPYRRNPGGLWWLALLGVPLVLALVGALTGQQFAPATAATATPAASASTPAASTSPSASTPAAPAIEPFGLTRSGDTVTLSGSVPDEATRTALVELFQLTLGGSPSVVDSLAIAAGAPAVDPAALTPIAIAMRSHPDLGVTVEGTTATLTGTVFADERAGLNDMATQAFPGATVDDQLTVGTPAYWCETAAKADIVAVISFETGKARVTTAGAAALNNIADTARKCPTLTLLVAGNSDNVGNAAANKALSLLRAKQVAAILVTKGVKARAITTVGNGSSDPMASNSTAKGRSLNRRVDVTIK